LSKHKDRGAAGRFRKIEKKAMASSGLEPATFRLAAWRPTLHVENIDSLLITEVSNGGRG
jgi:hypothetical protein